MSPLIINIILHYYARANDFREGDLSAPAVGDAVSFLLEEQIIDHNTAGEGKIPYQKYKITERGEAYVKKIKAIGFPVQKWVYEDEE